MESQKSSEVDSIYLKYGFALSNLKKFDQPMNSETLTIPFISSTHDMEWNMTTFTKVTHPSGKYYLSLFTTLTKFTKYPIDADIQYFIQDAEEKEVRNYRFSVEYPNIGGGNMYYISHEDLVMGNLIINNTLRVCVDINIYPHVENKSTAIIKTCMNNLCEDYGKLIDDHSSTDVILIVSGQEIKAHKLILSTRSAVFAALFKHDMKENKENKVIIKETEVDVFKEMLRFIYTGKVENIEKLAFELLILSDRYGLQDLKEFCELHLHDNLTIDNSLHVYSLAEKLNSENLRLETLNFITANVKSIMDTPNFQSLDKTNPRLAIDILRLLGARNMLSSI